MSINKKLLTAFLAILTTSVFAQTQPPHIPLSVDDVMTAGRAAKSPIPPPALPPLPLPPSSFGEGTTKAGRPFIASSSEVKKGIFLVAIFTSGVRASAQFQIDGVTGYYANGDRLKDGWVVRKINISSVLSEQCKEPAKCKSKVFEFESE